MKTLLETLTEKQNVYENRIWKLKIIISIKQSFWKNHFFIKKLCLWKSWRTRALTIAVPPYAYSSAMGRSVSPSPKSQLWGPGVRIYATAWPYSRYSGVQECGSMLLPGPTLGSRGVTYHRPPSPVSACAQGISIRQFHSIQLRWVFTPIPKIKFTDF